MALKAPEAPSLQFKAREGFITAGASEGDESEEEYDGDEIDGDEFAEEDFFEGDDGDEEFFDEESFDDEFFEDEEASDDEGDADHSDDVDSVAATVGDNHSNAPPPVVERREPTVVVQPADTGGRTGSALPTPKEMAEYASRDRGKEILRQFEEEDRRTSEQISSSTASPSRVEEESFFPIEPPAGAMKWILLIFVLAFLGFTIVRQLSNVPPPPKLPPPLIPDPPPVAKKPPIQPRPIQSKPSATKPLNVGVIDADDRPIVKRALMEVSAAYAAEESKQSKQSAKPSQSNTPQSKPIQSKPSPPKTTPTKSPRPRSAPSKSDEIKHIEIRI